MVAYVDIEFMTCCRCNKKKEREYFLFIDQIITGYGINATGLCKTCAYSEFNIPIESKAQWIEYTRLKEKVTKEIRDTL